MIEKEYLAVYFFSLLRANYLVKRVGLEVPGSGSLWGRKSVVSVDGDQNPTQLGWVVEGMFSFPRLSSFPRGATGGSATFLPAMFRIPPRLATNLVLLDQLSWPGNGLRKATCSHSLFSKGKASSREWVKRRCGVGSCIVRTLFSRRPGMLAAPSRDAFHISRGMQIG